MQSLEQAEEHIDDEIHKLERLDEDELEKMLRVRLDKLKNIHEQKQNWSRQVSASI